jgi:hypothetical protein
LAVVAEPAGNQPVHHSPEPILGKLQDIRAGNLLAYESFVLLVGSKLRWLR